MCELCHWRTAKSILQDWKVRHLHWSLTAKGTFALRAEVGSSENTAEQEVDQQSRQQGHGRGSGRKEVIQSEQAALEFLSRSKIEHAGKCPFMFLRKDKSSHNCYYLYLKSKKKKKWQDETLCHMHQDILTQHQGDKAFTGRFIAMYLFITYSIGTTNVSSPMYSLDSQAGRVLYFSMLLCFIHNNACLR